MIRYDNILINEKELNDTLLSNLTIYIYTRICVRNLYCYFDFFIDSIIVDGLHIISHEVVLVQHRHLLMS